jgi:hydroxypyruvate isomerase
VLENIDPEENPKYYLTSVAEGFDIIRKVGNPNVKFLYDFLLRTARPGNLIGKLQKNIDLVGVIHVADVPGRHDSETGEINYSNIYRQLVELNFTGTLAMEFLPTSEPVAALRSARESVLQAAGSKQ